MLISSYAWLQFSHLRHIHNFPRCVYTKFGEQLGATVIAFTAGFVSF